MMAEHRVRWMFHSTAMVRSYELACEAIGRLCGISVLEYSELLHPNLARRGGMTWVATIRLRSINRSSPELQLTGRYHDGWRCIHRTAGCRPRHDHRPSSEVRRPGHASGPALLLL